MKVVFVLPALYAGGAERVTVILSEQFVKKGIDVDIVLMVDDLVQYDIPNGVNLVCLNTRGMARRKRLSAIRNYLKKQKNLHSSLFVIPFQDSCLKNFIVAAWGLRIPIIAAERNNPYRKGTGFIAKTKASIPFMFACHRVFQTPDARDYYKILSDKKCSVIFNPVDINSPRWNGCTSADMLITACRLHKQKNLPMLIDSIEIVKEKYPNVRVRIFGDGDIKADLESYISSKNLQNNVILCGRTNDVKQKMAESSVFLLSSDFEGISNSMLEAMSVGIPIVSTDCPIGGSKMMLEGGAGVLAPVGDAKSFAQAIISILDDENKAKQLSVNAIAKIQEYTPEQISERWIEVLKSL